MAAAIALILMGEASVPDSEDAIAALLALLAPTFLAPALRGGLSRETASLVLRDPLPPPGGGNVLLAASRAEFTYRAAYGLAALGRLVETVIGGQGLSAWRKSEAGYFTAHMDASETRLAGARLNDAAASRYGNVLSWNHGPNGPNDRPHHANAHGANFDATRPPKETQGLPSMLPHCNCSPGPPRRGARMLR